MDFLSSLDISESGLMAQRKRMDIIADNLANIETTRTEGGCRYRRELVLISPKPGENFNSILDAQVDGVQIDGIVEDKIPFKMVYNPSHPDADENGNLLKPSVDLMVETTNLLMARRSCGTNLSAVKSTKQISHKALEIGR